MGDEDEKDVEDTSGYEKSAVRIAWLGWEDLILVAISRQIGTRTCCIVDGKLTRTQNSLKSQFLFMIFPISSHLSLSRPQLWHHLRIQS